MQCAFSFELKQKQIATLKGDFFKLLINCYKLKYMYMYVVSDVNLQVLFNKKQCEHCQIKYILIILINEGENVNTLVSHSQAQLIHLFIIIKSQ